MSNFFGSFEDIVSKIKKEEFEKTFNLYTATATARDPSEIRKQAKEKVLKAMNAALLHTSPRTEVVLPKDTDMSDVNLNPAAEKKDEVEFVKKWRERIPKAVLAFAMREGTFSESRYFVRVGKIQGKDLVVFCSMKEMLKDKGALQTAFAAEICQALSDGKDTSVSSFFKSKAFEVSREQQGFLFTKAMHAPGFPQDEASRKAWKEDMDLIMVGMKDQPKKDPEWIWRAKANLKFFKVAVKEEQKPDEKSSGKATDSADES